MMTYSVYLTSYFIIHSLLASLQVKKAATALFSERYYRILFNITALLLLVPVILMYRSADKEMIFEANLWTNGIGIVILVMGLLFLWKSLKGYDKGEFSGLKQLNQTISQMDEEKRQVQKLSLEGLNGYVRHPLYFAMLLVFWGFFVIIPNDYVLVTSAIATLYLFPGIYLEEKKLIGEFGQSYNKYKQDVPMLLPKLGIISQLWK